jgi:TPR repeat protein
LAGVLLAAPAARAGLEDGVAAYRNGDYAAALSVFRPLAEQGLPDAQFYLAQMYREGQGLPRDGAKARTWYARAAARGLASAQYNLGQMYRTGDGVTRDASLAALWYRQAAERGHPRAQDHLGLMYAGGVGVKRDLVEAYAWVALAAGRLGGRAEDHRLELLARLSPDDRPVARKRAAEYADKYGSPIPELPVSEP